MKTTGIGRAAEAAAAKYLTSQGFSILEQNYRTRFCEIDIVAKHKRVIYFVEVKYRSSDQQGGGLDYITPRKLSQIKFAANIWTSQHDWEGDVRLLAAAVSSEGGQFVVDEIIEIF